MPPNTFSIFLGDAKTMYLSLVGPGNGVTLSNLNTNGNVPMDLTFCTQISVALPNADGSFTDLTLIDGQVVIASPAVLGNFSATITSAQSSLLNVGLLQNLDVQFTYTSGYITTTRYYQALSVLQPA